MMAALPGEHLDPKVEADYMKVIHKDLPGAKSPERVEFFAFYERAIKSFAVVMTGETAKYGNIILKKASLRLKST